MMINLTGGGVINLPADMDGKYNVILFYRGHWWPYCRRQLVGFENEKTSFEDLNIKVFAASVDPEDKAQEVAEQARPYAERMAKVLDKLTMKNIDKSAGSPLLVGNGKSEKFLVIVATSERGLCGGFNSSIVKLAKSRINSFLSEGKGVEILTIGKKGREQLKREFGGLMKDHVDLSNIKKMAYQDASAIAESILEKFLDRMR